MDRRHLHKANNQQIGKNKQTSLRTRANNRAAHQDAMRQIEEPEVIVVKVTRLERMKQWRKERDEKKKHEEELKKKPFVTVVKRGVFTDKTNYVELNKQRRNKTAAKKPNVSQKISTRNATATSSSNVSAPAVVVPVINNDVVLIRTENRTGNAGLLAIPENSSKLNTTFETQNSESQNMPNPVEPVCMLPTPQNESEPIENANTPAEGANTLAVAQNSSVLNTTFEMETSVESSRASEANKAENGPFDLANTPTESTPRTSLSSSFNYVSPFVTISRGKGSARKEVKVRESFYKLELNNSLRNREAAEYFRFQVNNETTNLMQMIELWTKYKNDNDHVDSVYLDQIDVAIGQTRLLINKKFKQFLGLCDECEKGKSQPPVLHKDLEGFWSMVFMQVENCSQRFQKLTTLKENDWVEVDLLMPPKVVKQTKNRKIGKKGPSASSGIQKMIEEARLKMKESRITASSSSNNEDGRGFSMSLRQTPARLSMSSVKTPRSIIKAKTPGGQRTAKSVAFAFVESPSVSSESPKVEPAEPMPKVIKRRASTSGIPTEKPSSTAENKSLFLTPNNRKVSTGKASSSVRRSHRRLFSAAEK